MTSQTIAERIVAASPVLDRYDAPATGLPMMRIRGDVECALLICQALGLDPDDPADTIGLP